MKKRAFIDEYEDFEVPTELEDDIDDEETEREDKEYSHSNFMDHEEGLRHAKENYQQLLEQAVQDRNAELAAEYRRIITEINKELYEHVEKSPMRASKVSKYEQIMKKAFQNTNENVDPRVVVRDIKDYLKVLYREFNEANEETNTEELHNLLDSALNEFYEAKKKLG